jgi:hypothetical protein
MKSHPLTASTPHARPGVGARAAGSSASPGQRFLLRREVPRLRRPQAPRPLRGTSRHLVQMEGTIAAGGPIMAERLPGDVMALLRLLVGYGDCSCSPSRATR